MKSLMFAFIVAMVPAAAFAEQANPVQDKIALQLGSLIIANTSCGSQVEQLSAEVNRLTAAAAAAPAAPSPAPK